MLVEQVSERTPAPELEAARPSEVSVTISQNLDLSCQSRSHGPLFLSFVSSLIRRTDHNRCPVSTSLAQTHLHQPYTRHSVLIGHLP